MAIGTTVISAFAGSADPNSFPNLYSASQTKTIKTKNKTELSALEKLYKKVRDLREAKEFDKTTLASVFKTLTTHHSGDWLLSIELLELIDDNKLRENILDYLNLLCLNNPDLKNLVSTGIALYSNKSNTKT